MLETDPRIKPEVLLQFAVPYLEAMGCKPRIAVEVAHHLIDAELCGVYSHGIFRLVPYAEKALAGHYNVGAEPFWRHADGGAALVDGDNGLGISAFLLAVDEAVKRAKSSGIAAIGVVNVDHTGRIGDFAARAARAVYQSYSVEDHAKTGGRWLPMVVQKGSCQPIPMLLQFLPMVRIR